MEKHSGLPLSRNLKIGLFHLGSGMADVLTTGVWNRIMISDLGFSATIVGLLTALRYFLAPLGIWAGRMSDARVIGGYRRLFWTWLGRALMLVSTLLLGYATAQLVAMPGQSEPRQWVMIVLAFLLFSVGSAVSGTTFLALVYDRAAPNQRGRAVGVVWTFLLLGFTVGGVFFGVALPEHAPGAALSFTPASLLNLFIIAAGLFAGLWFFALLGEEARTASGRHAVVSTDGEHHTSLKADLLLVWRSRPMRYFLVYLCASMAFAFSQDAILEPWGGDVFAMPAQVTNRFAAYWGGTAIVGTILFLFLARRYPRLTTTVMSQMGVTILAITFGVLALASMADIRALVTPGLILLGVGLGIWNVGTLGLMMELSPAGRAGTFLGFWTMAVTLARGGGVAGGGLLRDAFLVTTGSLPLAYGMVFALGAAGLLFSLWALRQVNVKVFQKEQSTINVEGVFAGAMD